MTNDMGDAVHMGKSRHTWFLWGNLKEKGHMENIGVVGGRMLLKGILKR
jgi:hypothetical protein